MKSELLYADKLIFIAKNTRHALFAAASGNGRENAVPGSGVERALGPGTGHVAVLADVGAHDGLAVVVVAVEAAEAEGGVEVPRLLAAAEGAVDGDGGSARVPERAAHLGAGEVEEHAAEDHVLAALLGVHAPGPVAEVELVAAKAAGQELVPLLPAQRPGPRRQVRAHRAQPKLSEITVLYLL